MRKEAPTSSSAGAPSVHPLEQSQCASPGDGKQSHRRAKQRKVRKSIRTHKKNEEHTKGETKQNAEATQQRRENAKLAANDGSRWRTSKHNSNQHANQHQLPASGTAGAPMGSGLLQNKSERMRNWLPASGTAGAPTGKTQETQKGNAKQSTKE